ncbi:DUF4192 domain-containing protein [Geodermatophilus sp. CPCC 206100]|uniref:DUF4192 domain-containing protein n=1 Tax=Geodermatophilus sp. CPCC 206100 TaxID=3020054 RepID=UPI003AFF7410
MDDATRPAVSLSSSGDIAAALPHLIGFHPHESVLVVGLGGPSGGRLGLTVRADLPERAHAPAVAALLARSLATDEPDGAVVAVVSEIGDERDAPACPPADAGGTTLPHRAVVHDLVVALAGYGIPVRETLLVRRGRWWSYDCPGPCCAPDEGTPLPEGVTELAVASVAAGMVVAPDRAALERRIAPVEGPARAAMAAAVERVGARHGRARRADPDAEARRSWNAVVRALRRCRPGAAESGRLGDRDVARVLWALADVRVRDRALTLALGDDAAAAETLWTECTRRAPAPLGAAPATLLAVSAWLRGDGAMANVALERALADRPSYSFARLLMQGLAACLPPAELRALITTAAEEPDEVWAGGAEPDHCVGRDAAAPTRRPPPG